MDCNLDIFCKHVYCNFISLAKWMNLIGGSSQLPVPAMWNYSTCIHLRSTKQRRLLRIKDESCKSNHLSQLWNWFKWTQPRMCSQICQHRKCNVRPATFMLESFVLQHYERNLVLLVPSFMFLLKHIYIYFNHLTGASSFYRGPETFPTGLCEASHKVFDNSSCHFPSVRYGQSFPCFALP